MANLCFLFTKRHADFLEIQIFFVPQIKLISHGEGPIMISQHTLCETPTQHIDKRSPSPKVPGPSPVLYLIQNGKVQILTQDSDRQTHYDGERATNTTTGNDLLRTSKLFSQMMT